MKRGGASNQGELIDLMSIQTLTARVSGSLSTSLRRLRSLKMLSQNLEMRQKGKKKKI